MLANALSKEHDVSVVLFRKMLPEFLFPGKKRIGKDLSTLNFNKDVKVFEGVDYASVRSWLSAAKFVKKNQPDVVIFQWWTSSVGHMDIALKILFKMSDIPLQLIEMHEIVDTLEEENSFLHLYSNIIMSIFKMSSKAFITHSDSDKKAISDRYKIKRETIHTIPHGPYNQYEIMDRKDAIDNLNLDSKDFIILYFGLIRPYKGVKYLIEAFNDLPHDLASNCTLLLIGELWDNRKEILSHINSSKYKNKIESRFEYVPDEAVSRYFSACDVLVLPYLRVSQSGVAHIGINFGIPIIVTRVGGLKKSMNKYEGTIFVEPTNSTQIKENLITLYNNRELKRRYESPLSWEQIVEKYTDMIKKGRGDIPFEG
jgi:glycosyltransferase involved in cell wall biosynthesis